MKTIDFEERSLPVPDIDVTEIIWNVLTAITLTSAILVGILFLRIFLNPQSAYNPFPPPTLPALLTIPTATPAPRRLPPTWTVAPSPTPTVTTIPRPTSTLPPTTTSFTLATATSESTPAATQKSGSKSSGMPFVVQKGNPIAIANIYHEDLGCNWMGVGGQVFDLKNSTLRGQQIQLGGVLAGTPIPEGYPTLTGLLPYAPGYYEFTLGSHPIASRAKLWVQLVDQAGLPMSDRIYFDTFESCEKNLIIINFKQVR